MRSITAGSDALGARHWDASAALGAGISTFISRGSKAQARRRETTQGGECIKALSYYAQYCEDEEADSAQHNKDEEADREMK